MDFSKENKFIMFSNETNLRDKASLVEVEFFLTLFIYLVRGLKCPGEMERRVYK